MIVIKTEMKELPKRCSECSALIEENYGDLTCGGGNSFGYGKDTLPEIRPEWCPLIEVKDE